MIVVSADTETADDTAGIAFNATASSAIGSTHSIGAIEGKVTQAGTLKGDLVFHTNAGDSFTEGMRLDSAQRLGVGCTAPSSYQVNAASEAIVIGTGGTSGSGNCHLTLACDDTGNGRIAFTDTVDSTNQAYIRYDHNNNTMDVHSNTADVLHINASGNVGIGTTSPYGRLNAHGPHTGSESGIGQSALFVSSSDSLAAHKGGVVQWGGIYNTGGDVTQWAAIEGLKENATSGEVGGYLRFVRRSNSSGIGESMRITSAGDVGIGTTGPSHKIDVVGTAGLSTGTAWTNTSDARVKTDVETITGATEKLKKLRPVSYRYTDQYLSVHPEIDGAKTYHSFIADEYETVFPDAVSVRGDLVKITPAVIKVEAQDEVLYVDGDTDIPEGKKVGDVRTLAVDAVEAQDEVRETLLTDLKQFTPHDLQMFLTAAIQELEARVAALESA